MTGTHTGDRAVETAPVRLLPGYWASVSESGHLTLSGYPNVPGFRVQATMTGPEHAAAMWRAIMDGRLEYDLPAVSYTPFDRTTLMAVSVKATISTMRVLVGGRSRLVFEDTDLVQGADRYRLPVPVSEVFPLIVRLAGNLGDAPSELLTAAITMEIGGKR